MPKLSDTMTRDARRVEKEEGIESRAGDVIAEMKPTSDDGWESPEDGTFTEIYVKRAARLTSANGLPSSARKVKPRLRKRKGA